MSFSVEILCSSRELFGADRSALRVAQALSSIGLVPTMVVPRNRPEFGLSDEIVDRGLHVQERPIAIASSRGVEGPLAMLPMRARQAKADLTIFNTTAVLGSPIRVRRKIVVVREWLSPRSTRHRMLVARHRSGAAAVAGVSTGVLGQWQQCIRGPGRQYVVHNWLDRSALDDAAAVSTQKKSGILCIGRFNMWKGQGVLADAYEEAFRSRTDRPALRFVGAQPGAAFDAGSESLRARGMHLGWEVLPFASDPADYFRAAAVVVVPSLRPEPFGTVILEALSHGCRVIAFDGGGPSDIARDFPGVVQLVRRERGSLSIALASWWDQGGHALSHAQSAVVHDTLEQYYSPEAGATAWRTIIEAVTA